MKRYEFPLTIGTIKNLIIVVDEEMTVAQLVEENVKQYVKYMCNGGLVSDDVLISSIGASNFKKGFLGGCKEQFEGEVYETIERCLNGQWDYFVLAARYGHQVGLRKSFERSDMEGEEIDRMMAIVDKVFAAA